MAERAGHLVDHVFPDVPVRRWVLSVPYRLRYLLAWDHDLCRAVAGLLARAVFPVLRKRARDGTTVFLGQLAVLVPRPRVNLVLHYGVLGARSAWPAGPAEET